eukprot:CAMPEP_0172325656 /NCGR_PEP_ID=MMETSP1058-20130122/54480_1 /TAXON_ID=83371 /ORGANISM="Detonula confervacea, Strain CCMP 353" /LENGTH=320 /DNA_ID=CAMNT_0013042247 /DNA_START=304 /DNA_END=1266 /DNA_ORIENTATION=+
MASPSNDDATASSFYNVRHLTPHFGIEALDIDLNEVDLTKNNNNNNKVSFISQLKQDLIKHRAILFRNQSLSGQRQVDISNALGTIESTFYKHPKSPHPDIFRVSNNEDEGCTQVGRSGWHIDGTFQKMPFMYQTMYFPSVAHGGDTYFVPLKELYDSFSLEEREYYDTLWMATGRREALVHPLVYKHPFRQEEEETMLFHCGRPFVTGWYCDSDTAKNDVNDARVVNGVDTSKMVHPSVIQDQLTKKIESKLDDIGIRMKWQEGDFLISDNLGLAHYASEGTQGSSESVGLRILHRTTVVGGRETIPSKLDGRSSFTMR